MRKDKLVRELIRAWDPVAGKTVWEHENVHGYAWLRRLGVMSTAGNLVFQGRGSGELWVYAADSGKGAENHSDGQPHHGRSATYTVNGEQYVAVQAGYGGAAITVGNNPAEQCRREIPERQPHHRLQAGRTRGAIGRAASGSRNPEAAATDSQQREHSGRRDQIRPGMLTLPRLGPSVTPDLRNLLAGSACRVQGHRSARRCCADRHGKRSMILLTEKDVEDIHAYLIDQASQAYK